MTALSAAATHEPRRPAPAAMDLTAVQWPYSRLGEALEELARRSGLQPASKDVPVPPDASDNAAADDLGRW
ncbi:MAG: hypothetical protein JWM26_3514, partial [Betaproteobacteria bacterium]|nr:hypothetical protein [Betaproteobacteria bacterium]